jgi:iron uptake system component EfeO
VSRRWLSLLAVPALLAAACGSSSKTASPGDGSGGDAQQIAVTISDNGCEPREIAAKAGPTTFSVTNDGSAAVTEFEVLDGTKILGEVENVIPGADRTFSLTLKEGTFVTYCPNGKFEKGVLQVAAAASGAAADSAARQAAVADYLTYVKSEVDLLQGATTPFVEAVKAGDIAKAKTLFAAARYHYESVEPIAESFGDLDPAIDIREPDVEKPEDFTGFHRIEKALWVENDLSTMGPVADKLVADIASLRTRVDSVELEPAQIANGAVELLNEVSTSKITGEEDAFSHTDLSDFAANLAGAKAAFESVKPLLAASDADLSTQLEQRFTDVQQALDAYKGTDPVGNGYELFTSLTPDNTRALSSVLDTLAEPLSKVAAKLL